MRRPPPIEYQLRADLRKISRVLRERRKSALSAIPWFARRRQPETAIATDRQFDVPYAWPSPRPYPVHSDVPYDLPLPRAHPVLPGVPYGLPLPRAHPVHSDVNKIACRQGDHLHDIQQQDHIVRQEVPVTQKPQKADVECLINPLDNQDLGVAETPPCLNAINVTVLERITRWIESSLASCRNCFSLLGAAGSGKSTIAWNLANHERKMGRLGGQFYFIRGEEARNAGAILALSHQIASWQSGMLRSEITSAINGEPGSARTTMDYQFQKLIQEPLQALDITSPVLVIILDGLDKCDPDYASSLLRLISNCLSQLPATIKFFITSCAEPHLQYHYESESMAARLVTYSLGQENPEEVWRDTKEDFKEELSEIMEQLLIESPGENRQDLMYSPQDLRLIVACSSPKGGSNVGSILKDSGPKNVVDGTLEPPLRDCIDSNEGESKLTSSEIVSYHILHENCAACSVSLSLSTADAHLVAISQSMGGGGFCGLFLGMYVPTGQKLAMKRPRPSAWISSEVATRRIVREAKTWSRFKHKNILLFCGLVEISHEIYLVSLWMEYGDLSAFLTKRLSFLDGDSSSQNNDPRKTVYMDFKELDTICGIASGLAYLHAQSVVHGDLKGLNVLLTQQLKPVICDFGMTKVKDLQNTTSLAMVGTGTLRWMSSEVMLGGPTTIESDIYSFGMAIVEVRLAYFMLFSWGD
ncbi:hypothetical protein FRB93_011723 [Tulasnella sp. JGI-2019a]|nr:hypothetical protein FRB93_011723 [Tulasnella sp. JGI-2019a]